MLVYVYKQCTGHAKLYWNFHYVIFETKTKNRGRVMRDGSSVNNINYNIIKTIADE